MITVFGEEFYFGEWKVFWWKQISLVKKTLSWKSFFVVEIIFFLSCPWINFFLFKKTYTLLFQFFFAIFFKEKSPKTISANKMLFTKTKYFLHKAVLSLVSDWVDILNFLVMSQFVFECSQLEFLSFSQFELWVLSQFEFLRFVTVWVVNDFFLSKS